MIDFDILTIIIGIVILIILLVYLKIRIKVENVYLVFYSIFYLYLMGVLKYTIFPIPLDPYMAEVMSENTTFLNGINLIPFIFKATEYLIHKQVLLNIVLSIPFGFGISYITKVSKSKLIVLGLLFGVAIEGLQLIISLTIGYTYRYIDINDIVFNFIGTLIGYCIFRFFSIVLIKVVKKFSIELNFILEYIYKIGEEAIFVSQGRKK